MKNCQETIIYTWYTSWKQWKQWKHMFVVNKSFNECIESTIWLYNDLTTSSLNMWLAVKHPLFQVGELFVIQPYWINRRISAVSNTLIGWWFCLDDTGCRPSFLAMIMNHSPLCKSFLIHGLLSFNLVKYVKIDWTDTGPIIINLLAKSSFRFNSDLYGLIHVNSNSACCGSQPAKPQLQPASKPQRQPASRPADQELS